MHLTVREIDIRYKIAGSTGTLTALDASRLVLSETTCLPTVHLDKIEVRAYRPDVAFEERIDDPAFLVFAGVVGIVTGLVVVGTRLKSGRF